MADICDKAQVVIDQELARNLAAVRAPLQVGTSGECEFCGWQSARLVGGACAPCRDERRLN